MRIRKILLGCVSWAVLLMFFSPSSLFATGSLEARKAGWEESTPGRWNSLPERNVDAGEGFFRAEVALDPGTGVLWEKRIKRDLMPEDFLSIEMVSRGINRTSRDYRRDEARFPLSVTIVFGEDSMGLPWKKRTGDFFRGIWRGFTPGGIRLTFAYGNETPVNSMYRLEEEETVFILGGDEERGKRIKRSRKIKEDFEAAYGRPPRGPVTRILVSAIRPSGEDGQIEVEIFLSSPLLE
jgi:hypothetical protein